MTTLVFVGYHDPYKEAQWEKRMAAVCKPFTMARLRYFDVKDLEAAWQWLAEAS